MPGPEAQQLATYIGWLLHRTVGGLVAGTLFVLPGFIAIMALSILYAGYKDLKFVEAIFFGIKAAVLVIVVEALIRIGAGAEDTSWCRSRRLLHRHLFLAWRSRLSSSATDHRFSAAATAGPVAAERPGAGGGGSRSWMLCGRSAPETHGRR